MIVPIEQTKRGALFDQDFQAGHVCAACGGRVIEATTGAPNVLWVGCSNREHEGFERIRSYYELYKANELMPITIIEGIKKREAKGKARK